MPLGMVVGLGPGHTVLHGDPAPPQKGTFSNFRPTSIVAKRSPISVTAEHLLVVMSSFPFLTFFTLPTFLFGDRFSPYPIGIGPLIVCLSCRLSVCDVGALWPNGWMD